MNEHDQYAAEIDQHCNALEKVADELDEEGRWEAKLVRVSAGAIREACVGLNSFARETDDALASMMAKAEERRRS